MLNYTKAVTLNCFYKLMGGVLTVLVNYLILKRETNGHHY